MLYGLENFLTIMLAIVGFIIVLYAQMKITSNYNKNKIVENKKKLSGQEVSRKILDANNLGDIYIVEVKGSLTDHYDPTRKVIRLSSDVFHNNSIASISVAAHEVGHAIQDKENYAMFNFRSAIVPVVNLVTYMGYFVSLFAVFVSLTSYLKIVIIIILATLIFQLVTLPVEFDASKRAIKELKKLGIIDVDEEDACKEMLKSAAMTYVASFISTIINLLRMLIILNDRDDN